MSTFSCYFRTSLPKGFTLIELLVVVSIVILITAFVLIRHSRFDSSTLLRSLSYSVALSVRQAQVYGTSVRGVAQDTSDVYGYGVYFASDLPCPSGIANTCYALFADTDADGAWESTETVSTPSFGRGFSIRNFCAVSSGGSVSCLQGGGISSLTIYFLRPNPDARINTSAGSNYSFAYVEIQSGGETSYRTVKVTNTGQIAVCGLNVTDISTC